MSTIPPTSPVASSGAASRVVPMTTLVVGKVEAVRRFDSKVYSRIVCPAVDLYNRPSVVEVRSTARIGQRDEEVSVTCRLGGYVRKAYRVTDRETGEQTSVTPVDHTLDLVE